MSGYRYTRSSEGSVGTLSASSSGRRCKAVGAGMEMALESWIAGEKILFVCGQR